VQCLKRIYHPSIDLNGRVCLGLINEWMSILNFESIIIELEQLLAQPSPSKPLVKDVGTLLLLHACARPKD
jgi:ubiquitin-conjugating enzyme E2 M